VFRGIHPTIDSMKDFNHKPLSHVVLVLHDIRSVINVGSIFRTAEGFAVGKIIISGYTPGPLDRFGRVRQDFHKAALGSEENVVVERIEDVEIILNRIKKEGRKLIVLEQDERAIGIGSLYMKKFAKKRTPCALVVGNETEGVSSLFLNAADVIVEIPMFGKKESFNVSSATAIALFALL
jgi:23S rRNA (guanosine2251-2'-O)-methyltransferase